MLVKADTGGDPRQRGSCGLFDDGTRKAVPAADASLHRAVCVVTLTIAPCLLGTTVALSARFRVRNREFNGTIRSRVAAKANQHILAVPQPCYFI